MGILLLVLGLLSALSGWFKLRLRVRTLFGSSRLAVLELVAGAMTVLGSGVGLAKQRPVAWGVVVLVSAAVVVSSVAHARRMLRLSKRRATSEQERLERHLRA
jgi:hypothetical protein